MAVAGIGIIGVGRMGRIHAEAASRQKEKMRLVAVADEFEDAAEKVANITGASTFYKSPYDLISNSDIQGVVIATPSWTHYQLVQLAIAAGKDVLCEKPLAMTIEETNELIDCARSAGVRLQVGFMRRFDEGVQAAKKELLMGNVGKPIMYKALQRDESAPPSEFCDPKKSGGIFVDMGVHEFDTGCWLFEQEVVEVYAMSGPVIEPALIEVGDVDNVCVQLKFDGGAVGQIDLSRNARYGDDIRFEILGETGALFWGDLPAASLKVGGAGYLKQPTTLTSAHRFFPAWSKQIEAFASAINNDHETEVTGKDSLRALAIAIAAQRSLERGEAIAVNDIMTKS